MNKLRIFSLLVLMTAPTVTTATDIRNLPVDGYAATVNERIITIGEVFMATREVDAQLRARYGGQELIRRINELFYSGLEQLIDHALIKEEFNTQGLQIPERLIDDHINDVVLRQFQNDRAALLATLAEDQITLEEWRDTISDRMIVRMMRAREIGERIVVSPRAILDAYETEQERYRQPARVLLRVIFLRFGSDADAAWEQIQNIRATATNETAFANAARDMSHDASSTRGGAWEWVREDFLRPDHATAVRDLKPGEVSEVVAVEEGLFLLMVRDREATTVRSFDEVRRELEAEMRDRQAEELYRAWVQRLRNKFSVIYHITLPVAP